MTLSRYITPGVYIEQEPERISPLQLAERTVFGVVGLCEKGPLNSPVTVSDFSQFRKIFGGFTDYSYLPYSVYGFFASGGKLCTVVRVAHMDASDPKNSASKSFMEVNDVYGKASFIIEAVSEGTWGNYIQLKLWHSQSMSSQVRHLEAAGNAARIFVDDTSEYGIEDFICLRKPGRADYGIVSSVTKEFVEVTGMSPESYSENAENTFCEALSFNLHISRGKELEEYLSLSANPESKSYFIDIINKNSKFVKILSLNGGFPESVFFKNLSGGSNGVLGLTAADFIGYYKETSDCKGLGILESSENAASIAIPDLMLLKEIVHKDSKKAFDEIFTVQRAMIDQAEKLKDRFVILDVPEFDDVQDLIAWRNRFDSEYAAMYYPNIKMTHPGDTENLSAVIVPPSGHIAGVFAKCDSEEGIFRAPANKYLCGAVDVERHVSESEYEITYPKGLNCLRYVPGKGIKVWGARTLSSDQEWRYINVRRTFSAIRDSIRDGMGWAVFEPNNMNLRKRIVRHVTAFLIDLWRKGFMSGVTPEEAFLVRCDDELNPPEEFDAGRINVEIGLALVRPAEFIVMSFTTDKDELKVTID